VLFQLGVFLLAPRKAACGRGPRFDGASNRDIAKHLRRPFFFLSYLVVLDDIELILKAELALKELNILDIFKFFRFSRS
jgi:hypothetical protein